MNYILKNFLFTKRIFVNDTKINNEENFYTVFTLANKFGIRITKGMELATFDMISLSSDMLGVDVPEPFYRGFPESVKALSKETKLFDQLLSYALTYGLNDFSEARHSMFEEPFERIAFHEDVQVKDFAILTEDEAVKELDSFVSSMLSSTRPLNQAQMEVLCSYITDYNKKIDVCASKDTAISLILHFKDASYAKLLKLPDIIRFVEVYNYTDNGNTNIKKLNLSNKQRKFVSKVLDTVLENTESFKDIRDAFEKRSIWNGLLHHIHYSAKNEIGKHFVDQIRNANGNLSAYSDFEKHMSANDPVGAAEALKNFKGSGAVARNLNYILSRCKTAKEVNKVLDTLGYINPIMSIQMLLQYKTYTAGRRTFKFVRYNKMVKHHETEEEIERRKSGLSSDVCALVEDYMLNNLNNVFAKNKVGKVYIDDSMKKVGLPLQEAASSSGFGVLPRGTRLPMPEGNKIRCFTYWEKVNDIDLSAFGITDKQEIIEFSWRTAWDFNIQDSIVFSGDETSGYYGGSEYFDIDLDAFKEKYPKVQYIVFADNVYSNLEFNKCFCKAGYMLREKEDSGEVYEPKTVKTSFTITGDTTYAVLFALDLASKEVVWLNIAMNNNLTVAGEDSVNFVLPYMNILDIASVYTMFAAKATEIVDDPKDADLIVSDGVFNNLREGQKQIHSYDYELLLKYINQ